MRRGLGDAADAGCLVAVEDREVLADRDLAHRLVELVEVRVGRAAVDVVELDAGDLEFGTQLEEWEHPPLCGHQPFGG